MLDKNTYDDDKIMLRWEHRVLRRLLVKLSKTAGVLPTSMFLKGVECRDRDTVAGGGFADIFHASYQAQEVALKRLRVSFSSEDGTDGAHSTVRSIDLIFLCSALTLRM